MSKKYEFNLQNIPIRTEEGKRILKLFKPDPLMLAVEDMKGFESGRIHSDTLQMKPWAGKTRALTFKLCPSRRIAPPGFGCEGYLGHEGDHHACNSEEVWKEDEGENVPGDRLCLYL